MLVVGGAVVVLVGAVTSFCDTKDNELHSAPHV